MTQKRILGILALCLVLSLGGNFFQAGLIIGKNAELKAMGPMVLPAADQKIIQQANAVSKPKMDELRKKFVDARATVQSAMNADPFSKEELDAALKDVNERQREFLVYVQQQRAATIQKLSPEGQAMLQRAANPRGQQHYPPFVWEDVN